MFNLVHFLGYKNFQKNVISYKICEVRETVHEESPLKEEMIINNIETRDIGEIAAYGTELSQLVSIIERSEWTRENQERFPEFYKQRDRLSVWAQKIFLDGIRFVPETGDRAKIIAEAHRVDQGVT